MAKPLQVVGDDELVQLVIAAREDAVFRKKILAVLRLPASQREAMVRTAVDEMKMKGEPRGVCTAFLALANAEAAEIVTRLISE